MRTHHSPPLQEFRTVADLEWSERRWPAVVRVAFIAIASGIAWGVALAVIIALAAIAHH